MGRRNGYQDERVKRRIFPLSTFIPVLFAFVMFTTVQMYIIGELIDYKNVPRTSVVMIIGIWVLAAAFFTLLTSYQLRIHYQQPIEEFSEAAHKVAEGDFSVYLAPHHTADKATHLDVLFADFNKMVEALGSIETLKTDFFSNVSHEIKTPLAVIQNHAYLLQKNGISEETRLEYAQAILQATKRLSSLITNMLKLNKLEKQSILPMPEEYNLCEQLCDCALQFEEIWEQKNIEFVVEMEDVRTICADEGLLELVWTNLISNALKFTPEGGTITLRQVTEDDCVTVSVSDTGCGMARETVQRIFEKFYQGDSSHATEGNGLGLALVKRILELSDGSITVESEPGKGSVFTVALPLEKE